MKEWSILLVSICTAFTALAREPEVPEGMVLVPGAVLRMGIQEQELETLAEMGKRVPHMSMTHARWWFGDEMPSHEVAVEAFFIDAHEVTNARFRAFVEATGTVARGRWEKYAGKGRDEHPVVNVTWEDAAAYARWAGKRLPTEAEWELAARGGADHRWFSWGDEPDPEQANYRHQGESFFAGLWRIMGLRRMRTKPVGSYPPNGFGLYDVHGNVAEWTADDHRPYPGATEKADPYRRFGPWGESPPEYGEKVVRGGGWETPNAVFLRLTSRSGRRADSFDRAVGFRCVRSVEEAD